MEANMNTKQILPVFMVGLFITTTGICDTFIKCIPNSLSSCQVDSYTGGSGGGGIQWKASCNSNNTKITFKGLALCAQRGSSPAINLAYSPGSNTQCWCRMFSPALSNWVSTYSTPSSETTCNDQCASICAREISGSSDLIRRLVSSLADTY